MTPFSQSLCCRDLHLFCHGCMPIGESVYSFCCSIRYKDQIYKKWYKSHCFFLKNTFLIKKVLLITLESYLSSLMKGNGLKAKLKLTCSCSELGLEYSITIADIIFQRLVSLPSSKGDSIRGLLSFSLSKQAHHSQMDKK